MSDTITVDIEISCSKCGDDLNVKQDRRGTVLVDPCEKCIEEAKDKADSDGYGRGVKDAEVSE